MKGLVKIELSKIVKRKDFLLMLSMIFIPVMYSIGLAMNSKSFTYVGEQKVSGLGFASEMYTFVYMCFVYFIILSVGVIRSLKGEIENKSIQLYVQRINNRKKIFFAKSMAYHILLIGSTVIFILISLICFYLFVVGREDIAVLDLCSQGEFLYCVSNIISILLCFVFTINVSMFFCAYRKSFEAMGMFIFMWLAFMYLKQLAYIKYFVPIYYVEKIVNADVGSGDWKSLITILVLVFIYSVICMVFGWKKFEKSDI